MLNNRLRAVGIAALAGLSVLSLALASGACSSSDPSAGGEADHDDDDPKQDPKQDASTVVGDAAPKPDAGGPQGPCDPKTADCVACGTNSCDSPLQCCYEETGASCGSCADAKSRSACDGPEDCTGGQKCCVMTFANATTATGVSECAATCKFSSGSTGTRSVSETVACHSKSDCAGVRGEFGVPYSECCTAKGYDVGVCLSQTFASEYESYGGACN